MEFLNTIFYFVVTIGVLVFVHELGHFLAAKLSGMRVDRFSIGFPPRAFGKKIGDTDYCISWIPIGGYVKIAGMVDESMDTEFIHNEPQPWEFRSKPLASRVFVISAGVIMNILLAVGIFWGINYSQGKYIRETTEVGYVVPDSPAEAAGLQSGDRIVSIAGKEVANWDELQHSLYFDQNSHQLNLQVERGSLRTPLVMEQGAATEFVAERLGIYPAHTVAVVGNVESGKPADDAGMNTGDVILSLGGQPVFTQEEVVRVIRAHAAKELAVKYRRNEEVYERTILPTTEGRIGITIGSIYTGPTKHVQYSIIEAFPEGVTDVLQASGLFYKSILQLITGKVSFAQSFGGPIKIAQLATRSAEIGLTSFLAFMAVLSMSLAILNILPFPALDGGHLFFLILEAILRKEIPHKVKIAVQQAGFIILLAFMAFVIYNDIINY